MAKVPPRQVAVLSIENYDDMCNRVGPEVALQSKIALKEYAVACGVDPGFMRDLRQDTILLRLDQLPRERFLEAIGKLAKYASDIASVGEEGGVPRILVGGMSERALRSLVNDAALDLLSYIGHTDCHAAFLAADDIAEWQSLQSFGVQFVSHEMLKGMDSLTGMLVQSRFFHLLDSVLKSALHKDVPVFVLYFDIDDFKAYNRTFGHPEGDKLLLFVAQKIKEAFPTDVTCHLSVDRFAVLTSATDIAARVASIHKSVRAYRHSFAPEVKCGVFELDAGVDTGYVALDCAKLACESIKGRFDVALNFFSDNLKERLFTRRYVTQHAEQAVRENWIEAYAQPVIDAHTQEVCGFEALARWNDPTRGLLSPAMFIPTLEDAHLIDRLDLCMVDAICCHLAERKARGEHVVPASVNLSRLDFGLCDILSEVISRCERWGIDRSLLAVEVTESALHGERDLRYEMDRFRDAGFEVWMDDFGCGYSSLNLLKDYDFDVLKVDMEFLRDMEGNERSRTIVAAVLEMARSLGIRTLVEGVEKESHREFLMEAGCDMMQGYLFGKPRPLEYAEF